MRTAAVIAAACVALLGAALLWSSRDAPPPPSNAPEPGVPSSARMNAVLSQAVGPVRGGLTLSGRVTRDGSPVPDATVTATVPDTADPLAGLACGCEDHCGKRAVACACQNASDLLQQAVDSRRGEAVPVARTTTAADGTFTLAGLEPGAVDVWADAATLGTTRVASVEAGARDVDVAFAAQLTFKGRVLRDKRAPAAFAWVAALGLEHGRYFDVTADADGRFTFGPLPKGEYVVVAGASGGLTAHGRAKDGVELIVPLARSLTGIVTLDRRPVAGVTVHLEGQHRRRDAVTAGDGTFTFDGLRPGRYGLSARREPHAASARVDLEASTDRVVLALERTVRLTGTVASRDGRPREGVEVVAHTDRDEQRSTTSSTGAFAFTLYPAEDVIVSASGTGLVPASREVKLEGEEVRVELVLVDEAIVSGLVVDAEGAPLEGARVRALGAGERAPEPTLTDATGAFTLRGLQPGEWLLRAAHNDAADAEAPVRAPVTGVRLQLGRGLQLNGQVVTHQGRGVAASVWVEGDDFSKQHETESGSDGRFTLGGLDEGTVTVQVQTLAGPPQRATQVVELAASRPNDVRIELSAVLPISGTVVTADSLPVANVWVFASQSPAVHSASAQTRANGDFELGELTEGEWTLTVTWHGAAASATARAGATAVRLKLAELARVHGRAVTGAGAPLTKFTVDRETFETETGEFEVHVARSRPVCVGAEGYLSLCSNVTVKGSERIELGDIILGKGGDLDVQVVDRDGRPLAGANLLPFPARATPAATTGADGLARIRGVVAPMSLTVERARYVTQRVYVAKGQSRLTVTLLPGVDLKVHVVTAAGRPAAAVVTATCLVGCGNENRLDETLETGWVALNGLHPGRWQIVAAMRGKNIGEPLKTAEVIELEQDAPRTLELTLPTTSVTLEVIAALPAGTWSQGAATLFSASLPEPRSGEELDNLLQAALAEAPMDATRPGYFEFSSLAPGRYRVAIQLRREGPDAELRYTVPLEVGEAARQSVRLAVPARVY